MNGKSWLGAVKSAQPSIFDLSIAGMFGIVFFKGQFQQGMFFVFYSIFLACLTFFMKPKREYLSYPLALLILWSFAMIFVHNKIKIVEDSFINNWLNLSIMFEGFIYILFGALLLRNIIIYSKNLKFAFFILPVFLVPLFKAHVSGGRMTIPIALMISVIIYLFLKRKIIQALILSSISFIGALILWKWIAFKFACRPYIWIELSRQIQEHPFIGTGFDHTLKPDNMTWVRQIGDVVYGWVYRHNDYLSLAAYLGVIVLIFLVWFTIESILKIGNTIYLILFLTIALTAFFQLTFFEPDKAAICLVLMGACIKETYKGEENAISKRA